MNLVSFHIMYIGEYIGFERLDLEFKEFCLKIFPYDYFEKRELRDLINGSWNNKLNNLIFVNIEEYIKLYAPKCVSSFINSRVNGSIIIGCNDDGEISGIPLQIKSKHDLNIIKHKIKNDTLNILNKKVDLNNNLLNFNDIVTVEVVKLSKHIHILEDEAIVYLKKYQNKIDESKKINYSYRMNKKKWMKSILKYSAKLHILLNTQSIREEIISFIKLKIKEKKITIDLSHIIKKLESSKKIEPPNGDDMRLARSELSENEAYATLAFWLAYFKDTKLDEIMKERPKRLNIQIPLNPFMILQRLCLFRYRFLNKNKNIEYFMIKINVNVDKINNIRQTLYYDTHLGWVSKKRICEKNGPCQI